MSRTLPTGAGWPGQRPLLAGGPAAGYSV